MAQEMRLYLAAVQRFDAVNCEDPNATIVDRVSHPKELLYARRMTQCLEHFAPNAPEVVRLAARAQHICRWEMPRHRFAKGRQGYRRWRTELADYHAQTAGQLLQEVGYDGHTIARVQALLRKERLKTDPECQLLEDVICLVFLQYYAVGFALEQEESKLIRIIQRIWAKMSPRGRAAAIKADLPPDVRKLIQQSVDEKC